MENFSTNSLAIVLSSTAFSEDDYIRQYDDFLKYKDSHKVHVFQSNHEHAEETILIS